MVGGSTFQQSIRILLVAILILSFCAPTAVASAQADSSDRQGVENDVDATQEVDYTPENGLSEAEKEELLSRTMARIELVRDIEFQEDYTLTFISRKEFRQSLDSEQPPTWEQRIKNGRFEALFMVDQRTRVSDVRSQNLGAGAQAYYLPSEETIYYINSEGRSGVQEEILAQELMHAYQLTRWGSPLERETYDAELAETALIEGDANLVQTRYTARCQREWNCVSPTGPREESTTRIGRESQGMYSLTYYPYSAGVSLVRGIEQQDGWEGVNQLYDNPPRTSKQVTTGSGIGQPPSAVELGDYSADQWEPVKQPNKDREWFSMGQASLRMMFVTPAITYQVVNPETLPDRPDFYTGSQRLGDRYEYSGDFTEGWRGGKLRLYHQSDARVFQPSSTAYVWRTEWNSKQQAAEFQRGYLALLDSHNATSKSEGLYRLPSESGYSGQIRVEKQGKYVTVTKAPAGVSVNTVYNSDEAPSPSGIGPTTRSTFDELLRSLQTKGILTPVLCLLIAVPSLVAGWYLRD